MALYIGGEAATYTTITATINSSNYTNYLTRTGAAMKGVEITSTGFRSTTGATGGMHGADYKALVDIPNCTITLGGNYSSGEQVQVRVNNNIVLVYASSWSPILTATVDIKAGDTITFSYYVSTASQYLTFTFQFPQIVAGEKEPNKAIVAQKLYVGVNGKARKALKAYIGDANNKARLFWKI